MIEIETRVDDIIFLFNRTLTESEKILTPAQIRNLNGYISERSFQVINIPKYTLDYLVEEANKYQFEWFDSMGVSFLLNVKIQIMMSGVNLETHLVYQMINAVERFIQKIWYVYDTYKLNTLNSIDFECDYTIVGNPPCKFGDIKWLLSSQYQLLEPNRLVITDINYYKNWQ